jgi:hypothetical protein
MALNLHFHNAKPRMQDFNFNFNYVQEDKTKVMVHPSYQPGPSPSKFWLLSCLKCSLDTYLDATSLAKALSRELHSISIQEYRKAFQKWIERMKLCIEHREDYFEHLL